MFLPQSGNWIAFIAVDPSFAGTLEVHALPDWTLLESSPTGPPRASRRNRRPEKLLVVNSAVGDSQLLDDDHLGNDRVPAGATDAVDAFYSHDGRLLVTASRRGDLTIRDPSTFNPIKHLSGAGASTNVYFAPTIAFSNDSRFILTALDGRARLWDVATGEPIGEPFGVSGGPTPSVVGGSTPKYITHADGRLHIWNFDVDHYHEMACQAAGRNMTSEEWAQYGPHNEAYHANLRAMAGRVHLLPGSTDLRRVSRLNAGTSHAPLIDACTPQTSSAASLWFRDEHTEQAAHIHGQCLHLDERRTGASGAPRRQLFVELSGDHERSRYGAAGPRQAVCHAASLFLDKKMFWMPRPITAPTRRPTTHHRNTTGNSVVSPQ